MPVFTIDDPGDARLAGYRDIRERDLIGRQHGFVAEGRVVIERLLRGGGAHRATSLLIAAHRLPSCSDLLADAGDLPIYAASQPVLDSVAGFALHRGLLALGARGTQPDADALLASAPEHARIVVLVDIGNHDNIGGIFRNAAAFGAHAVLLAGCADPLYRKAIRVSVGATLTTSFAAVAAGDIAALLARHGFTGFALSPHRALTLGAVAVPPRAALLLGAEGPGLPEVLLASLQPLAIPIVAGFDSLNVATTSGIALYHFSAGRLEG